MLLAGGDAMSLLNKSGHIINYALESAGSVFMPDQA